MDKLKLNEGYGGVVISTDECGALLVEGIEEWIKTLAYVPASQYFSKDGLLMMQDNKTGARFLITRLEE